MRDSCYPQYDSLEMHVFGASLGIEHSYVKELMDKHRDDPEQFLVEVIHHWLQKHPEPHWSRLEFAMDYLLYHRPHSAVCHALQTLKKEYEG